MSNYFIEIKKGLNEGKRAKRIGWPNGCYISQGSLDSVDKDDLISRFKLNSKAQFHTNFLIKRDGSKDLIFGYALTKADKTSQDWQLID